MTAPEQAGPVPVGDLGRVHLVGVGGAGMSAVALLLAARGLAVSGSDAADGPALPGLRAAGVDVHVGHDAALVADVDTLVVSSAVRETNPELAAARAAGGGGRRAVMCIRARARGAAGPAPLAGARVPHGGP